MKTIKSFIILLIMSIQLTSCNTQPTEKTIEKWKQEVVTTELNFSKMAGEKGVTEAFLAFAADDAVLMRSHKIISGKNNLKTFLLENDNPSIQQNLKWAPDFVDVSVSGDLAYTYGKFTLSYKDSIGIDIESKGIFHTVWKRQPNREWKFVWD